MNREKLLPVIGIGGTTLACVAVFLIIFFLSAPPQPSGPPLYPEPPTYAGATDLKVTKGDALERLPTIERERQITFTTPDTPQAVLAYYEETLKKAGWSLFERIDPNELNFYWSDGNPLSTLYKVNVRATPSDNRGTEVRVETGFDAGGR